MLLGSFASMASITWPHVDRPRLDRGMARQPPLCFSHSVLLPPLSLWAAGLLLHLWLVQAGVHIVVGGVYGT